MKRLPISLAVSHAVLVTIIYAIAISDVTRYGSLSLVMFFLDLPVSLICESVAPLMNAMDPSISYRTLYTLNGIAYFCIGTPWYYLIGIGISYLAKLVKKGFNRTHE